MNQWGTNLRLALFGESHGPGVGAVLDGVPAGMPVDTNAIEQAMAARRPGGPLASQRVEPDAVTLLSGAHQGRATGAPLALWIPNVDARSADYPPGPPRPGHADLTEHVASRGHRDPRGGGHHSGRLTAPLVAAGALLAPFLEAHGVTAGAHVHAIGAAAGPEAPLAAAAMQRARASPVATGHAEAEAAMVAQVEAARAARDSVGGLVRFAIEGLPMGAGAPHFAGIEPSLGGLLLAVPAAKAVEFGAGMRSARMRGSEHNDAYEPAPPAPRGAGGAPSAVALPRPRTNHAGGALGGRATGAPVWGTVAIKPTSTIAQAQDSVDLQTGAAATLVGKGRHDPCIAIRAAAVVRACCELAAADWLLGAQRDGLVAAPRWE